MAREKVPRSFAAKYDNAIEHIILIEHCRKLIGVDYLHVRELNLLFAY